MNTPENIEDSLGGGYLGLVGEVVTYDCYRLTQLDFIPDVVIDLGGNVGVFARFAAELFPKAKIYSVEPHPENQAVYEKFTKNKNITLIKKAVGVGTIWHDSGAVNGSGEVYMSAGLGYPLDEMDKCKGKLDRYKIDTVMPSDLISMYVKSGQKVLVKIDIEGSEHTIFTHEPSMKALRKCDYVCMEVHFYALHGGLVDEVKEKTLEALSSFDATHDYELDGVHFWARKKK